MILGRQFYPQMGQENHRMGSLRVPHPTHHHGQLCGAGAGDPLAQRRQDPPGEEAGEDGECVPRYILHRGSAQDHSTGTVTASQVLPQERMEYSRFCSSRHRVRLLMLQKLSQMKRNLMLNMRASHVPLRNGYTERLDIIFVKNIPQNLNQKRAF